MATCHIRNLRPQPGLRYTPRMPVPAKISEFIERAKANGASDQSVVGILTARGWPEKEVHEALAAHYERVTGIEVPRRSGAGTAARDAFFYLLAFATLATWTIGAGSIAFTLIDRWIGDTLFSGSYYSQVYDTYSVASALAATLVSFPIYLLVSRALVRDGKAHPEKLGSPVRKWLTCTALVIAAGVFIGDLIAALTYLLRGALTSRFIAKAFVVLALSGGVFFYYFGGVSRQSGNRMRALRDIFDGWRAEPRCHAAAGHVVSTGGALLLRARCIANGGESQHLLPGLSQAKLPSRLVRPAFVQVECAISEHPMYSSEAFRK
jgi:hypothetical protein